MGKLQESIHTSAVSSGRQIPTNEHRGHFGLSTSGARNFSTQCE